MKALQRALPRLLLLAVVLIAGAQVLYYFTRTVDDLFISLRFAERFAGGDGPTYNAGERVEGFSSPLWMLLQAAGITLGFDGVTATKLLSVASVAALLGAMYLAARRLTGAGASAALLLTGVVAADSCVMGWAFWGLETPLYLALLVLFPVVLDRALEPGAARRSGAALAATTIALATCRPEAPLYIVTLGLAVLAGRTRSRSDLRQHARTLWRPVAVVALVTAALLIGRRLYFGLWLPHTYYAKQGAGFDVDRLRPLFTDGAHPIELLVLGGGLAWGLALLLRRRPVALAGVLTCAFFVGSVAEDWMPSLRHLLPVRLFAVLAWGTAFQVRWRAVPAIAAAVLVASAAYAFQIDARYSKFDFASHGSGKEWLRLKNAARWRDAWDMLRRSPPAHARALSVNNHGQADPLYLVLEASATPEPDDWFLGQDIGLVGYLSPVKVFDTAGLFTPDISDRGWRGKHDVSDELARRAFARKPVAAEFSGPWSWAFQRLPAIAEQYRVVAGVPRAPYRVVRRDVEPPPPAELVARYDRVAGDLPRWFYVSTLYGEAVGALIEKRVRWVSETLSEPPLVVAAPSGLTGEAVLDGVVKLHGCRYVEAEVVAGSEARLECYFEAQAAVERRYSVFVHLVDAKGQRLLGADHPPVSGWLPADKWPRGRIVRDVVPFPVPAGFGGQRLTAYVGLFEAQHRAAAEPSDHTDGENRVVGPVLTVR